MSRIFILAITTLLLSLSHIGCGDRSAQSTVAPEKMKALLIDGENNHGGWPKTSIMMKDYLEQTGLFEVDIARKAYLWLGPHNDGDPNMDEEIRKGLVAKYPIPHPTESVRVDEPQYDPDFSPDFSKYDLVVSNLGWKSSAWPMETQQAFETYMRSGGGLVVVHAADNPWGDWTAFNQMIGLGGWGDRSKESGPYVYYDETGQMVVDTSAGQCGSHGPQQDFVLTVRDASHPITKGLPKDWIHGPDELYDRLRGPAEHMNVLATAYSDVEGNSPPWDKSTKGTGRHEPMLMTIDFGQGRTFHSTLGHADYSMESVGFIVSFQRGAEWAASGKVTQAIPQDFPTATKTSVRPWKP